MRIAIFSEGRDDQAVIVNVLKGALGIESSDIIPLRPELTTDATDQSTQNTTLGGWSRVKKDCEEKERLEEFLDFNIDGKIVIHLDTAEAHEYGVTKPTKPNDLAQLKVYSQQLRLLIIDQIKNWTKGEFEESLWHAIAIEETEAWLLPLFISCAEESDWPDSIVWRGLVQPVVIFAGYPFQWLRDLWLP